MSREPRMLPVTADEWRGDEHRLQTQAAAEAGIEPAGVALALYRRGFASALTARDPVDGGLVLRGRTVLRRDQLQAAIIGAFAHLGLTRGVVIRVDDGDFEVRVAAQAIEGSAPAIDATRRALLAFVASGLVGLLFLRTSSALALLAFSFGLLGGAWVLRSGLHRARELIGGRLVDELARLAHQEQLILPPARPRDG
ncbi:MAG: hypothetical protein IPK80_09240 [Nannocystis sp.]|nr:hypothetical protein [Nannocystis sp.]